MIVVGQIVRGHGIRGEVVVRSDTENPLRFRIGAELLVDSTVRQIIGSRPHGKMLLVHFQDIESRTAADQLRGAFIFVDKDEVPPAREDSYWEHELAGCEVFDSDGHKIGVMTEIVERAEQDLWRVTSTNGEVLVPAVKDIVISVDIKARRIVVDLPEGLL